MVSGQPTASLIPRLRAAKDFNVGADEALNPPYDISGQRVV